MKIINYILLTIAFVSVPLMYLYNGKQSYEIYKLISEIAFSILLIMIIPRLKSIKPHKLIKYWIFAIILSLFIFLYYNSIGANYLFEDIVEFIIPFIILVVSYYLFDIKQKLLRNMVLIYSLLVLSVGIYLIVSTGGFVILPQYRELIKNQITPFFAVLSVFGFGYFSLSQDKFLYRISFLLLGIFLFAVIVILRGRTALLSVILALTLIYFKRSTGLIKIFSVSIFIFVLIFFFNYFDVLLEPLYKSLFLNYDTNDLNSITTGRLLRSENSIQYILKNLLLGISNDQDNASKLFGINPSIEIPHIYILFKILKYGLLGALPFIGLYLYISYYTILKFIKSRNQIYDITIYIMVTLLFESLGEYSAPYGPGSSYIVAFFLLGQYLKINPKIEYEKIKKISRS